MAGQFSLWLAQDLLDLVNRKTAWTPSYTNMYLGLATSGTLLRANTLTNEISTSSTGYARVAMGYGSSEPFLATDANGKSIIDGQVDFAAATASWGTVSHAFMIDTASGTGDVYIIFELEDAKVVSSGDVPRIIDTELWVGL